MNEYERDFAKKLARQRTLPYNKLPEGYVFLYSVKRELGVEESVILEHISDIKISIKTTTVGVKLDLMFFEKSNFLRIKNYDQYGYGTELDIIHKSAVEALKSSIKTKIEHIKSKEEFCTKQNCIDTLRYILEINSEILFSYKIPILKSNLWKKLKSKVKINPVQKIFNIYFESLPAENKQDDEELDNANQTIAPLHNRWESTVLQIFKFNAKLLTSGQTGLIRASTEAEIRSSGQSPLRELFDLYWQSLPPSRKNGRGRPKK